MRKPRSEYPSEQSDKFLIRLPDGMRERLADVAKANSRSMNAEIVHRLSQSLESSAINKMLDEYDAQMGPHDRVILKFNRALDAMMEVRTTIKREYGVSTPIFENDED